MTPRRVPNLLAVTALAMASLLASACSDDDPFPRDEFVEQVTGERGGVTEEVANCTYDGIDGDAQIMEDLKRADGPNDKITANTDEKLSKIIARCLLDAEDGASETDENSTSSTTTEPETDGGR